MERRSLMVILNFNLMSKLHLNLNQRIQINNLNPMAMRRRRQMKMNTPRSLTILTVTVTGMLHWTKWSNFEQPGPLLLLVIVIIIMVILTLHSIARGTAQFASARWCYRRHHDFQRPEIIWLPYHLCAGYHGSQRSQRTSLFSFFAPSQMSTHIINCSN